MDELLKMVASPVFWVGTVLVGIALNFGTTWAYGRLAAFGSKWAQARANKSQAEFERDMNFILSDERALPIVIAREVRERWYALLWLLFSVMFLIFTLLVRTSPKLPPSAAAGWPATLLAVSACLLLLSAVIAVRRASHWRWVIEAFAQYVEIGVANSKERGTAAAT